jgi:hypothetical protein|nr:hypothetical protein [Candidatus Krumholzibacteria bacterium]
MKKVSRMLISWAMVAVVWLALGTAASAQTNQYIFLISNDLGMHCMNRDHAILSVLPPYNTFQAQVIRVGDADNLPLVTTEGLQLEYRFPGNTYSVGKTDFWTHAEALFGVALEDNVGLTGKTLDDVFDVHGDLFVAEGIPLTPFNDDAPTVEVPYQVAEVILRDSEGLELARAYPVAPVSVEMSCVSTGCHSSETSILNAHEDEDGFDPTATPILCAQCHGSTPLTGPSPGSAGWFSRRIHDKHDFMDETIGGLAACQKCHPGPNTRCLRGTMGNDFGMICQDCHGDMGQVASSIENGRIPWVDEPACGTCHTSTYGEPAGVLYRNARGHGGVLCSACHNSPHAIFPSREAVDNQVMMDLQGHAGTLSDCRVCHGVNPSGPGPHGVMAVSAVEEEIVGNYPGLKVFPSPATAGSGCTIMAGPSRQSDGRLMVFNVKGQTVRMMRTDRADQDVSLRWDGRDAKGRPVSSGVYFLRYQSGDVQATAKVVMVD